MGYKRTISKYGKPVKTRKCMAELHWLKPCTLKMREWSLLNVCINPPAYRAS